MKHLLFAVLLFFCSHPILAQQYILKGNVQSTDDNTPFPNVTVLLLNTPDSIIVRETLTHSDGSFDLEEVGAGEYVLRLQYLGYERTDEPVEITKNMDVGTLYLHENARLLDEVTINMRPPVDRKSTRLNSSH